MKTILFYALLFSTVCVCSCKSKPSEKDISKKILFEYVCPENAAINGLKVTNTKETESLFGLPALQYTVSGEIQWSNGCDEAFGNLPPGYKEEFKDKVVTLVKTEQGWQ